VACDEVYIVAGLKGEPEEVRKHGGLVGADNAKAHEGEATR